MKQLRSDRANPTIGNEAFYHDYFVRYVDVPSRHIVDMIRDPTERYDESDALLGPEFDGLLTRLYLEFCENGCIYDLLEKRIAE